MDCHTPNVIGMYLKYFDHVHCIVIIHTCIHVIYTRVYMSIILYCNYTHGYLDAINISSF